MYEYKVMNVARVIDGDTFDFDLDLGFYSILRVRIRLANVDTYEIFGRNTHPLGVPARDFASDWLQEKVNHGDLGVRTYKLRPDTPVADGAFGRWLGEVFDMVSGELLADVLIEEGFDKEKE